MRQIEVSQAEQRLEYGIVDLGQVVVGHVDGVKLVEFRKRLTGNSANVVVRHVQDFQARHILQRHLKIIIIAMSEL